MSTQKDFPMKNGFIIDNNGTLERCVRFDEDIVVPEGVTSIGRTAFSVCASFMKSVSLPDSVTIICEYAFYRCGKLTEIVLPKNVIEIQKGAFFGCGSLRRLTLPDGLTKIGSTIFNSRSLKEITIPDSVEFIADDAFDLCDQIVIKNSYIQKCLERGEVVPARLHKLYDGDPVTGARILFHFPAQSWQQEVELHMDFSRVDMALEEFIRLIQDRKKLKKVTGERIIRIIQLGASKASGNTVKILMDLLKARKVDVGELEQNQTVQEWLASSVPERLAAGEQSDSGSGEHPIESVARENYMKCSSSERNTIAAVRSMLTGREVKYADRDEACSPEAVAVVVCAYVKQFKKDSLWDYGEYASGIGTICQISRDADQIAAALDRESLCALLEDLARQEGYGFFIPYCRYADEKRISVLVSDMRNVNVVQLPSGSKSKSIQKKNVIAARSGLLLSDTWEAMQHLDEVGQLDTYANLRGTTADAIRDRKISNIGLDAQGGKAYDLGNQTVTVRLQKDFSFLVERPDGKTAETIPEKDADPEKYEQAKESFARMKQSAKAILKKRKQMLFKAFLSGDVKSAEDWRAAYLENSLLRVAAGKLVWAQGEYTFTLSGTSVVDSTGAEYILTDDPVRVAHPMEMEPENVAAWQKYFLTNGIKQPFIQIWEPVIREENVLSDRYDGCVLPMARFTFMSEHGIYFYFDRSAGQYDPDEPVFWVKTEGCGFEYKASISNRGFLSKGFNATKRESFTLGKFSYQSYNRQVNHIVGLLDLWVAEEYIKKNDVAVMDWVSGFTLLQLEECIALAEEKKAAQVRKLLQEYKDDRFAGFGSMGTFTLEW